jgi:hypothetical protein
MHGNMNIKNRIIVRCMCTKLHGVTNRNKVTSTFIAARNANLTAQVRIYQVENTLIRNTA